MTDVARNHMFFLRRDGDSKCVVDYSFLDGVHLEEREHRNTFRGEPERERARQRERARARKTYISTFRHSSHTAFVTLSKKGLTENSTQKTPDTFKVDRC